MAEGTRLGRYTLVKRLHVGGLAEVYLAVAGARGFEQAVAIKKLLSAAAHDEEFLSIFLDEARISVQLSHPNIVHVLEVGSEDETYFLAMEYVAGRTLADLLARLTPDDLALRVPLAAFVVAKIAEGLDSASRCTDGQGAALNIVHRAVSPGNVLVSYSGEVKLLDFGTARATNRSQHTQVGMLKGKLGYLSPEQLRGADAIDRRADLFAAGVVLHELLTGERLFPDGSILQSLERVNNRQVPPPSQKNPHVPPELDQVVARALADQPDARYQWGGELAAALAPFLKDGVRSSAELAALLKDRFAAEFVSDQELLRKALASSGPALPEPRLSAPGRARPLPVTPGEPEPRLSTPPRPPSRSALPPVEADSTRAAFPVLMPGDSTSPSTAAVSSKTPSRSSLPPVADAAKTPSRTGLPAVAAPRATPARPSSRSGLPPAVSAPRPPSKRGLAPVTDPLQPAVPRAAPPAERTDPSGQPLEPEEERTSPSNPVLPGAKALLAQAAASASRPAGETTGPVQVPWDVALGVDFEPPTASMPVTKPPPESAAPQTTEEPPPPDERTHVVNVEALRPTPKKKAAKQKASAAKARADAASEVTSPGTPLPPGLRLPPRRTLLLAAGAVGLVLLVGGAIAAMSRGGPTSSAVIVRCVPPVEAKITVAGRLLTPGVATQLPPGDYDLVALAPGFKTHTQRISVIAGEQVTQVTVLLEAVPSAGSSDVPRPAVDAGVVAAAVAEQFSARFTGTAGAEVLVDGVLVGTLPGARAEGLTVGRTYAWLVRKSGFAPASGTLSAAAPEEKSVVAELKPAGAVVVRQQNTFPAQPQGTGFLVCTSVPPGAQVLVDGKATGRKTPILPDAPLELGAGKHAVVLELNGTRSPARNVTVEAQKMVKLFNVKVEDTEILETPDLDTP